MVFPVLTSHWPRMKRADGLANLRTPQMRGAALALFFEWKALEQAATDGQLSEWPRYRSEGGPANLVWLTGPFSALQRGSRSLQSNSKTSSVSGQKGTTALMRLL